ncbi:MAG: T9SS type A sorting domain-containing protein [Bacteroidales bacterium]|jgi:1,4-alpha-glucan branching enzyme|nr:T9SS type A sorting domain-containing protein [Bacteroidales bacterium]
MPNNRKRLAILLVIFLFAVSVKAQIVSTTPIVPVASLPLTLTYYSDKGTAGLKDYGGTVYCHTGVITSKSVNNTDWKYVKSAWGENLPELQLTKQGNNEWIFSTGGLNIREFYNIPDEEDILRLAFVFRSGEKKPDGSYYEGKDDGGTDIFVEVSASLYNIKIGVPSQNSLYVVGDNIPLKVEASQSGNMQIYCYTDNGGKLIHSGNNTALFDTVLSNAQRGFYTVIARGTSGEYADDDTVTFLVRGQTVTEAIPAGLKDGINYYLEDPTKVTLVLRAPWKDHVFVVGDFNKWQLRLEHQMKCWGTDDNAQNPKKFWVTIEGLTSAQEYAFQYIVDDSIYTADPYCEKVLDPWNDRYISNTTYPNLQSFPQGARIYSYAGILQTAQKPYKWIVENFTAPPKDNLVIYELLMRDFMQGICSYDQLRDTLTYLQRLGINAIELMPVMEFDGNESWGYNPAFYFAPDKAYGTAASLKRLIDECHRRGIAIILDIVLNHAFGNSPTVKMWWDAANNRPSPNNPYHNVVAPHELSVGEDFNHNSPHTQYLMERILKYWIEEYNIDGYRFDMSKGFTQNSGTWDKYDQSRVDIINRMANIVRSVKPDVYIILEHWGTDDEENVFANNGMMLWRNIIEGSHNFAMGWGSNAHIGRMVGTMNNFVSYFESHDEERVEYDVLNNGNAAGTYNIRDSITALDRMAMASTMLYASSGPKMLWQFGELGYSYSIGQCWDTTLIHNERCRTDKKPVRWDYLKQPARKALFNNMSKLIHLKTSYPAMDRAYDWDFHESVSGNNLVKWQRLQKSTSDAVVSVVNGDVVKQSVPVSLPNGRYYELFSGDSIDVVNGDWLFANMNPGEYRVYTRSRVDIPDVVVPPEVYPALSIVAKDRVTYMQGCEIAVSGTASRADSVVVYVNDKVKAVYKTNSFDYNETADLIGEYRLAVVAANQYGEEIRSVSYKIAEGGTMVEFLSPLGENVQYLLGTPVNVVLQGTNSDRITLYQNGYQVATVTNDLYLNHTLAGISDTGTYYLEAVATSVCSEGEASSVFKVVKPSVKITSDKGNAVNAGQNVTLTATAPLADSIFFNYNAGGVALCKAGTSIQYTIHGITEGTYMFTAYAKGRYYDGKSTMLLVNVAPYASNEELTVLDGIKVYPNPVADGVFTITTSAFNDSYVLVDVTGKTVRKGRLSSYGFAKVDVRGLPSGVYILRIGSETVKVVLY